MADPTELAQKARITLAAGLQALQEVEDAPEQLLDAAEPIARTMGMLHRIEKSGAHDGGLANEALQTVRSTLDALQNIDPPHEAVDSAMEAVAGSLSKLFALTKALGPVASPAQPSSPPPAPKKGSLPPAAKQPSRPPPPPRAKSEPPPAFSAVNKTVPHQDASEVREQVMAAQAQAAAPPAAAPAAAAPPAAAPAAAAPPAAAPAAAPPAAAPAAAAPPAAAPPAAAQATVAQAPSAQPNPAPEQGGTSKAGVTQMSVELGAHSPSNFYKGLSGNDVIDHGGIFVATYKVPAIGTPIALRMLLPGDLEFHADAIVQWTRDIRGGETDPGFGAKFTRIPNDGRELVYRYVKNREPIFYDDL